jgi:hypothetical protein
MAEAVEHALVRNDAVGQRQLVAGFIEGVGHGRSLGAFSWELKRRVATWPPHRDGRNKSGHDNAAESIYSKSGFSQIGRRS